MYKKRLRLSVNMIPYVFIMVSIFSIVYFVMFSYLPVQFVEVSIYREIEKQEVSTLRWSPWLRVGEVEIMKSMVRGFNESQDQMIIEMVPVSMEHHERRGLVDLMAGRAPDIFFASEEFLQLLARDEKIYNLSEYFNSWEMSADFLPDLLRIGSRDGLLYGIPVEMDMLVIYYNEDKFRNRGLSTPSELYREGRWNWYTFEETARALSTNGREQEIYGMVLRNWWPINYSWIYQNGGIVFDHEGKTVINSKQVRQTIRFLRNMIEEGSLLYIETTQEGGTYAGLFKQQRAGMIKSGGWLRSDFKNSISDFEWGIAPLPEGKKGDRGSSIVTAFLCINEDSEFKEQAWEFIKFFTGPDGQRLRMLNGSNVLPSLKSLLPEFAHIFRDFQYGRHIPSPHLLWPETGRAINQGLEQIWRGASNNAELYLGQLAAEVNLELRRIQEGYDAGYAQ